MLYHSQMMSLCVFPPMIRNKTGMSSLISLSQHFTGGPNYKYKRRRYSFTRDLKGRNKFSFMLETVKNFKASGTNKWVCIKVIRCKIHSQKYISICWQWTIGIEILKQVLTFTIPPKYIQICTLKINLYCRIVFNRYEPQTT